MKKMFPLLLLLAAPALVAGASELNLMPWPAQIEQQPGFLRLTRPPRFQVTGADPRVRYAVSHFSEQLAIRTADPFRNSPGGGPEGLSVSIRCSGPGLPSQSWKEDESYRLVIDETGIALAAPNPLGVLRGVETILQLLQSSPQGWGFPYVRIDDHPRFPWRGLMIDVSRHFMPVSAIKRNLDGMAAVKLNVLHLHLSDDEGFRLESKRCPRLQKLASDGLYYRQSEIRDLIRYARDRGIRVIPEFDVPAHAVSWLVAYPQFSSGKAPTGLVRSATDSERPPLDPTREGTYRLLDQVFGEMAEIFPDRYFHIGGDEVDGKYWDQNLRIQAWMRVHHIRDNSALQAYFNRRLQAILKRHGKQLEGWDEVLSAELPRTVLIQSWRGQKSMADAARMGFQTILSAGWYLDLMYPASMHYAVDPASGESSSLTSDESALILGGEAAQWAEYVTPELLDSRLWPRLGAIAERLWSPASVRDPASMYRRLGALNRDLEWLDLRQRFDGRRMLQRVAQDSPLDLVETLAATVEPVKEYQREETEPYGAFTPLNRLVDAVPPESDTAREVNALAQRALGDPASRPQLRKWLTRWRENDAQLQPFLPGSALRAELIPLSLNLSRLAAVGLDAMDAIESGRPVTPETRNQQLAAVVDCARPHAELQIMVVPAIRTLLDAEPSTGK